MSTTADRSTTAGSRLHHDLDNGMQIPDGALVLYLPNDLEERDLERAIAKGVDAVRAGRTVIFRYPDPEPTQETQ